MRLSSEKRVIREGRNKDLNHTFPEALRDRNSDTASPAGLIGGIRFAVERSAAANLQLRPDFCSAYARMGSVTRSLGCGTIGAIRVQLGCSNHHNQPQRLTLGGAGGMAYFLDFPVESCCAPQCAD
jgi:hypothetical protein